MIFGILWLVAFFDFCSRMIVITTAATHYFNSSPANGNVPGELAYGVKCAYFHHIGSIAMGSCVIAIIQIIRLLFYSAAK